MTKEYRDRTGTLWFTIRRCGLRFGDVPVARRISSVFVFVVAGGVHVGPKFLHHLQHVEALRCVKLVSLSNSSIKSLADPQGGNLAPPDPPHIFGVSSFLCRPVARPFQYWRNAHPGYTQCKLTLLAAHTP